MIAVDRTRFTLGRLPGEPWRDYATAFRAETQAELALIAEGIPAWEEWAGVKYPGEGYRRALAAQVARLSRELAQVPE